MADISRIIQSAQRVLRSKTPAPLRPAYDAYENLGAIERAFLRKIGQSYTGGLKPFGEAVGVAAAAPQISRQFEQTQQQNVNQVEALNRMIDKSTGPQRDRFVRLRDAVMRNLGESARQHQESLAPTQASQVLPAAGRAALTTAGSLTMAGMTPLQAGISGGVGGVIGGAFSALGGQPIAEGVAGGIGQAPLYTGIGRVGSLIAGPITSRIAPPAAVKSIWEMKRLANLVQSRPELAGMAPMVARDVLARTLEGGVGGLLTGAIEPAKTPEERWENMKRIAATGALFSGGTQLAQHGIEAGRQFVPIISKQLRGGQAVTGQAGYYIGEKGIKPTDRKFSFIFDKTLRSEIGDTQPTVYPNRIEGDLEMSTKTGKFIKKPITDYFVDKKLFTRYPQIKNYTVEFYFGKGPEIAFSYGQEGRIGINSSNARPVDIGDAIIHEIQHSIDNIEGYPAGGAPSEVTAAYGQQVAPQKNIGTAFYKSLSGELVARDAELRKGLTPKQRISIQPLSAEGAPQDILVRTEAGVVPASAVKKYGLDFKVTDRGLEYMVKPTEVGITPYRGYKKPVLTKTKEAEPYFNTTRAKGFETNMAELAPENNVEIQQVGHGYGVWEGALEPTYPVKAKGHLKDVASWASSLGKDYNQNSVGLFRADPKGSDVKYVLEGVKNPDKAIALLGKSGIMGATYDADTQTLRIWDSGGQLTKNIVQLARNLGSNIETVKGRAYFINKPNYGKYIQPETAGAGQRSGVLQSAGQSGSSGRILSGSQAGASIGAAAEVRPPHQIKIESAINRGDFSGAMKIAEAIPKSDPYRQGMISLISERMKGR